MRIKAEKKREKEKERERVRGRGWKWTVRLLLGRKYTSIVTDIRACAGIHMHIHAKICIDMHRHAYRERLRARCVGE